MQEIWVWPLGWEEPLEEEMATHFSILAWKIPQRVEPGGLQFMRLQRVRHNWVTAHTHTHTQAWKQHEESTLIQAIDSCLSPSNPTDFTWPLPQLGPCGRVPLVPSLQPEAGSDDSGLCWDSAKSWDKCLTIWLSPNRVRHPKLFLIMMCLWVFF